MSDPPSPTPWGSSIGGYEIVRELAVGATALATAPGNRPVVLKILDTDCLVRGGTTPKLHPSIYDRLARVRELANGRVANLHGVEHDRGVTYLVWEYVPGETIEEWATGKGASPRELLLMARELILAVESLHARGIVHGAIHGRNVIVDDHGKPKLTHVSPLLYSEPRQDLESVAKLFNDLADRRGKEGQSLAALAAEANNPDGTLRDLGTRAGLLIDVRRDETPDAAEEGNDARRRGQSRLGAAVLVVVAIVLALVIGRYVKDSEPKTPRPPEAPPAMM